MYVILLRQISERLLASHSIQHHLALKCRAAAPTGSLAHLFREFCLQNRLRIKGMPTMSMLRLRLRLRLSLLAISIITSFAAPANADMFTVRGRITVTQGHISPSCRMVQLRRVVDNEYMWFRIKGTGQEDSIMAVTLAALTSGLEVEITYDPAVSSGCGGEPGITYISLRSSLAR